MRLFQPKWQKPDGEWQTGKVWWVQFHAAGKLHRTTLKTRDKRVAEMRALQIVQREERRSVGLSDPFEEYKDLPLADHVAAFNAYLATQDVSEDHRKDRAYCLEQFLGATRARTLPTIDFNEVQRWLSDLAKSGLSARSVNKRFQALRQLGNWVVSSRRLSYNPFQGLKGRNEETDRRRVRRALTDDEVARLLDAARRRPLERAALKRKRSGVSAKIRAKFGAVGAARAFLYELAVGTGLRRGELQGLAWADIDADAGVLTVRASISKSKRMQDLPLRRDLVGSLLVHKARVSSAGYATGPQDRVFPGPLFPTHMTFGADLAYAGLDAPDDQGRVVDFHSLRQTFVTRLSVAGVHPRTAQALARHSRLDLTMKTYTDVRLLDLRAAVEATPAVSRNATARSQARCTPLRRRTREWLSKP